MAKVLLGHTKGGHHINIQPNNELPKLGKPPREKKLLPFGHFPKLALTSPPQWANSGGQAQIKECMKLASDTPQLFC